MEDGEVGKYLRKEVVDSLLPIVRFLGHSFASALGFIIFLLPCMIPIWALNLLHKMGFENLAKVLHILEINYLYIDMLLFGAVLLIGVAELLISEILEAWGRIMSKMNKVKGK